MAAEIDAAWLDWMRGVTARLTPGHLALCRAKGGVENRNGEYFFGYMGDRYGQRGVRVITIGLAGGSGLGVDPHRDNALDAAWMAARREATRAVLAGEDAVPPYRRAALAHIRRFRFWQQQISVG